MKNLDSLINSQLDFKVLADMEHLESVIMASEIKEVNVDVPLDTEHDDMVSDGESSKKKEISRTKEGSKRKEGSLLLPIQPKEPDAIVGEFVLGLFDDGAYPGEVKSIADDGIRISCLEPVVIRHLKNFRLWKYPSSMDEQKIEMASVLPIRPCLDVCSQLTNKRNVIFELLNFAIVTNFVDE